MLPTRSALRARERNCSGNCPQCGQWCSDFAGVEALHTHAEDCCERKDFAECARLCNEALTLQEHPDTSARLGVLYTFGLGLEQNQQKGVDLLTAAAEAGSSAGECELGCLYMSGVGIHKDAKLALKWLRRAHDAGNPKATANLAQMYLDGDVEKNPKTALMYFERVMFSHQPISFNAAAVLGILSLHGGGGMEKDVKKGLILLELGHVGGNATASLALGTFYKSEHKDFAKAVHYFEAAHWSSCMQLQSSGCPAAAYEPGLAYFAGIGVEQDTGKGLYFLLLADTAGHAGAAETMQEVVSMSSVSKEDLPDMRLMASFFLVPNEADRQEASWQGLRRKYDEDWQCACEGRPLRSGRTPPAPVALQNARMSESVPRQPLPTCTVHVLTCSRHPPELRQALLEGPHLESCREELAKHGFSPELPCGAKVFVKPEHFESVVEEVMDRELKPYHIVASDDFVTVVDTAIKTLRSKSQVRVKSEEQLPACVRCETCGAKAGLRCSRCGLASYCSQTCQQQHWRWHRRACTIAEMPIIVERTFIHVKIKSSLRSAPSSGDKTASTTDADKRKGSNPRKA